MKKLFKAIRDKDFELVRQLISSNSELVNCTAKQPPKKDDGQSLLQVALKTGALDIAEYLIDNGVEILFNTTVSDLVVEEEKIKLIYTLGGTKKDTLFKVILPSSIPIIVSNMKVNIGLALVGVIIGEFLAAKEGLGYLIIYGSQVFQLDLLIMSIIILCIIAVGLYQIIHIVEKRLQL